MRLIETRETARQLVIGSLAAFKKEPSEAALLSLKGAVESWLKIIETAAPSAAGTPETGIN